MAIYQRISGRRGNQVNLTANFLRAGQLDDPFYIYRIEIYRSSVAAENIVDAIDIPVPDDASYPSPIERLSEGKFRYLWDAPTDAVVPDVYFDVWYFYGTDPVLGLGSGTGDVSGTDAVDYSEFEAELNDVCNRFWLYPDQWYVDGGLQSLRFGFEPLDLKFNKPELRPLQVGIMPLPLYDYDFNFVTPIIPFLTATISIWTENCEDIITDAAMSLKIRQGQYRSNPFVFEYMLDTSDFFKGTYKYRITITLPDGSTRVSGDFIVVIS